MSKQDEIRKMSREVTFHSCLLQAVLDRTEELKHVPRLYYREVKMTGNQFIKAMDKRLNEAYKECGDEEVKQGMYLIEKVSKAIDECWEYYLELEKKEEI